MSESEAVSKPSNEPKKGQPSHPFLTPAPVSKSSPLKETVLNYLKIIFSGGFSSFIANGMSQSITTMSETRKVSYTYRKETNTLKFLFQLLRNEGLSPFLPAPGYFLPGALRFTLFETSKQAFKPLIPTTPDHTRFPLLLAASSAAEFTSLLILCPLEAARIRFWTEKSFPSSPLAGVYELVKREGPIRGLYRRNGTYLGFGMVASTQLPLNVLKFSCQDLFAEFVYGRVSAQDEETMWIMNFNVGFVTGFTSGSAAAVASNPFYNMSQLLKAHQSVPGDHHQKTVIELYKETGFSKLVTQGLKSRVLSLSLASASKFAIFETLIKTSDGQRY